VLIAKADGWIAFTAVMTALTAIASAIAAFAAVGTHCAAYRPTHRPYLLRGAAGPAGHGSGD
jgi:hypothetical protein